MNEPLGIGSPSIREAPAIYIARSSTGLLHVWVRGLGYLNDEEVKALGKTLLSSESATNLNFREKVLEATRSKEAERLKFNS